MVLSESEIQAYLDRYQEQTEWDTLGRYSEADKRGCPNPCRGDRNPRRRSRGNGRTHHPLSIM